ncbi:MAG: DUF1804 family protein [Geobacteraceae bacterium]|nr:DUF1804 family protein [Geobacteraceae bacterium]
MGQKGDKAKLYDIAFRMYTAEGKSLTDIEAALGVSRQTLSGWKADTKRPGDEFDEWDKARQQKRSNIQRMKTLFERELTFAEESPAGSIPQQVLNSLNNLGSLVRRWEEVERAASQAENGPAYDRPKVFLENVQWIAEYLKNNDPEGLKVFARNFDAMAMAFKVECLNGNA